MKGKKWKVASGIFLLSIFLAAGFFALAAEYGSQDDPLVTLSYITNVVSPGTLKKVDEKIAAKMTEFQNQLNQKMDEFSSKMDSNISNGAGSSAVSQDVVDAVSNAVIQKLGNSSTGSTVSEWKLIDLASEKTLTMSIGTELLLRIGDANVVASGTPGLINLTSAAETNNGAAVLKSNLYIVTVEGRAIKATSNCKILIRGTYTIK
ncbi:MAG: hypothetical protein N2Z65_04175 [Clostridiales bacterium]|nr:hypothetical protein [Clostridiales bacterium]